MVRLTLLTAAVLSLAGTVPAQEPSSPDREAIVAALLDYADGYLGGSPDRMTRALSPYLLKRQLVARRGFDAYVSDMNADTLIDGSTGVKLPPEERKITTAVFSVTGETASASVFTSQFNDYVHLIKREGRWQILNVLWHSPGSAAAPPRMTAIVEAVVRRLGESLIAGDPETASAVLHPRAHIRAFRAAAAGRPRVIRETSAEVLLANLAAGPQILQGPVTDLAVTVEGIDTDIASARMTLGTTTLRLQLTMQSGRWRVLNVLIGS